MCINTLSNLCFHINVAHWHIVETQTHANQLFPRRDKWSIKICIPNRTQTPSEVTKNCSNTHTYTDKTKQNLVGFTNKQLISECELKTFYFNKNCMLAKLVEKTSVCSCMVCVFPGTRWLIDICDNCIFYLNVFGLVHANN